jgi:hypothetical protein
MALFTTAIIGLRGRVREYPEAGEGLSLELPAVDVAV